MCVIGATIGDIDRSNNFLYLFLKYKCRIWLYFLVQIFKHMEHVWHPNSLWTNLAKTITNTRIKEKQTDDVIYGHHFNIFFSKNSIGLVHAISNYNESVTSARCFWMYMPYKTDIIPQGLYFYSNDYIHVHYIRSCRINIFVVLNWYHDLFSISDTFSSKDLHGSKLLMYVKTVFLGI